ncbi:hypothetical protein MLD38_027524 [Melastoma candidum]|uniref:Uncharacterized protein n=1 Tax=Melastoma candidum TaxID=119954 RepID=A0ACB9P336_9MYRT|nr:hypothetical protein MLD38_027524 [Melastoma candidum]
MGCCPNHPPAPLAYSLAAKPASDRNPAPLPPQDDVKETVKEVLTKTQPLPSKVPATRPDDLVKDPSSRLQKQSLEPRVPDDGSEDRSSEICSRSKSFVSTADDNSSSAALIRAVAPKGEGRHSNGCRSPAKKPPARTQSPGSSTTVTASFREEVEVTCDKGGEDGVGQEDGIEPGTFEEREREQGGTDGESTGLHGVLHLPLVHYPRETLVQVVVVAATSYQSNHVWLLV